MGSQINERGEGCHDKDSQQRYDPLAPHDTLRVCLGAYASLPGLLYRMRPSTIARRAILEAFAKKGSVVSAADIEAERIRAGLTVNAFDEERANLRKRGILELTHDGNGHEVGTGRPLWRLAHPEWLTPRDLRRLRGSQASSAYRPGSPKYRAQQRLQELESTVATLSQALDEGTPIDALPAVYSPATTRQGQAAPRPTRAQREHWCKEFYDGGAGRCSRCHGSREIHTFDRPQARIELVHPGLEEFDPYPRSFGV